MQQKFHSHLSAALGAVLALGSVVSAAINMETVPVGNTGNTAHTTTGYGAVSYAYNIGKYEVTSGQYAVFLNAVAATDTFGLYNHEMMDVIGNEGTTGSGITRLGPPGQFTYRVNPVFENRPVGYVNFWDAARFANWMHNGQPTGAQDNSTTEDGAYTLTTDGIINNTITRNAGAIWAVTSEDEWYKAAYHKNDGNTNNYFTFPTSSNTTPKNDLDDVLGNNANFYTGSYETYPADPPYYSTIIGEFQNSASPYGTFDQGGNIREWLETIAGVSRTVRGGGFGGSSAQLRATVRSNYRATETEVGGVGFRLTYIPEPTSIMLLGLGVPGMLLRRRRAAK